MADLFMVFDVESIGLHGEGFAVAWVVVNRRGDLKATGLVSCPPDAAQGAQSNRDWVASNVPCLSPGFKTPREVRDQFWQAWRTWAGYGAVLVADCCWPVEARFLAACVDDDAEGRGWEGPYPLHDLASVLLAHGRDPLATNERLPDELPAHHPLNDARQSARLLVSALGVAIPARAEPGLDQVIAKMTELQPGWNSYGAQRGETVALAVRAFKLLLRETSDGVALDRHQTEAPTHADDDSTREKEGER